MTRKVRVSCNSVENKRFFQKVTGAYRLAMALTESQAERENIVIPSDHHRRDSALRACVARMAIRTRDPVGRMVMRVRARRERCDHFLGFTATAGRAGRDAMH